MKPTILYKSSKVEPPVRQKLDRPDTPLEKEYHKLNAMAVSGTLNMVNTRRYIELSRLLGK